MNTSQAMAIYRSEPCHLFGQIQATAKQVAASTHSPRQQITVSEQYGFLGKKVRQVLRDADYWVLKETRRLHTDDSGAESNGSITNYEEITSHLYCLANDGTLFSFDRYIEHGVDHSAITPHYETYKDETTSRKPLVADPDVFLAEFDWTANWHCESRLYLDTSDSIIDTQCTVQRKFETKGQGLLVALQAMLRDA